MSGRIVTPLSGPADDTAAVGFFRAAWLIVAQGGWWKTQEILEQLPQRIEVADAHSLLWAMVNRHRMLATRGRWRTREYAVTADCLVPRGITAGEAVRAITGQAMQINLEACHA